MSSRGSSHRHGMNLEVSITRRFSQEGSEGELRIYVEALSLDVTGTTVRAVASPHLSFSQTSDVDTWTSEDLDLEQAEGGTLRFYDFVIPVFRTAFANGSRQATVTTTAPVTQFRADDPCSPEIKVLVDALVG